WFAPLPGGRARASLGRALAGEKSGSLSRYIGSARGEVVARAVAPPRGAPERAGKCGKLRHRGAPAGGPHGRVSPGGPRGPGPRNPAPLPRPPPRPVRRAAGRTGRGGRRCGSGTAPESEGGFVSIGGVPLQRGRRLAL